MYCALRNIFFAICWRSRDSSRTASVIALVVPSSIQRLARCTIKGAAITLVVRIASEQRGTTTPASAKDQFVVHFSYEVGLVSNDLGIHTPYTEESRLDLLASVVARAEYSSGCRNER